MFCHLARRQHHGIMVNKALQPWPTSGYWYHELARCQPQSDSVLGFYGRLDTHSNMWQDQQWRVSQQGVGRYWMSHVASRKWSSSAWSVNLARPCCGDLSYFSHASFTKKQHTMRCTCTILLQFTVCFQKECIVWLTGIFFINAKKKPE